MKEKPPRNAASPNGIRPASPRGDGARDRKLQACWDRIMTTTLDPPISRYQAKPSQPHHNTRTVGHHAGTPRPRNQIQHWATRATHDGRQSRCTYGQETRPTRAGEGTVHTAVDTEGAAGKHASGEAGATRDRHSRSGRTRRAWTPRGRSGTVERLDSGTNYCTQLM
jgi:hypothetical protein